MPIDTWAPSEAVALVRASLSAIADPKRASEMAAYMKTDMPFYGVAKPQRTPVYRELIARFVVREPQTYEALVSALWSEPHRETKYLAIAVARRWSAFHSIAHMPLYRRLIVEGAWWDFVDDVASNLVGDILRSRPLAAWPVIDRWIDDEDMWLRRTALICQLKSKGDTDEERLFAFCAARAYETEFFIRKAIGWALRQYAKTAPDAVAGFVADHREQLSGLSYREATKHIVVRR